MSQHKIVFVDDDRFYANRWIERLRDKFVVLHFTKADEALDHILNAENVNCLILDVMMPVPVTASAEETARGHDTGLWLLGQIKDRVADDAIPVIVLTNRDPAGVTDRIGAMEFAGGLVEVRKKLDTSRDKLLELVRDMVSRWRGTSP